MTTIIIPTAVLKSAVMRIISRGQLKLPSVSDRFQLQCSRENSNSAMQGLPVSWTNLKKKGVVGPSEGAKPRKVLMSKLQYDERKLRMEE